MALPGNPPAATTPAAFKTWAQNVKDTLDDIIAGDIAFTGDIEIPDEAYDATAWNGSLEVPTKNAVRDKIESVLAGVTFTGDIVVPAEAYGAGWNASNEAPTKNDVYDKIETLGSLTAVEAKGYRTSAWTITGSAGTAVTVPFDTEVYDSGTIFNPATGEFTAASTAVHQIAARIAIPSPANTERFTFAAYVNGTERLRGSDATWITGMGVLSLLVSGDLSLTSGDVITFKINQVNGTLRAIEVGNERNSYASIRKG